MGEQFKFYVRALFVLLLSEIFFFTATDVPFIYIVTQDMLTDLSTVEPSIATTNTKTTTRTKSSFLLFLTSCERPLDR